jgi:hypothetical protein
VVVRRTVGAIAGGASIRRPTGVDGEPARSFAVSDGERLARSASRKEGDTATPTIKADRWRASIEKGLCIDRRARHRRVIALYPTRCGARRQLVTPRERRWLQRGAGGPDISSPPKASIRTISVAVQELLQVAGASAAG